MSTRRLDQCLGLGTFLAFGLSCLLSSGSAAPLLRAHAHNDYLHARPLLDAVDHGFWSVEADIWLSHGQLLVAHDLDKISTKRTLQALYLDPLRALVRTNSFARTNSFTLMIDVKSDAEPTYAKLRDVLRNYADVLTRFETKTIRTNLITVIISGERAFATMSNEPIRFAAIDGRLADLDSNPSPALFPLVSDNWTKHFSWRGDGPLPMDERAKLTAIVTRAHAQGRRIRFWSIPDNSVAWRELYASGVDLLNTDNLSGLENFLRAQ